MSFIKPSKILFIIMGREIGGLEKRLATLIDFLCRTDKFNNYTFLINKAQLQLLNRYEAVNYGPNHTLIPYGLPFIPSVWGNSLASCATDYMLLGFALRQHLKGQLFDVTYFTKYPMLYLRHFVNSQKKIIPLVDSFSYEKKFSMPVFARALKEGLLVDCLSRDLKRKLSNAFPAMTSSFFATPCSFIDYSSTLPGEKNYYYLLLADWKPVKG